MKSQASVLLHVMQGLILDARAAYPELKCDLDKDMSRLALYCRARGLAFFTLDLPHLDSLLLQGLECGRLVLEGPLSRGKSPRIHVPRLFSGLWLRVFDRYSCLKQDVDSTAVAFLRQFFNLGKKLRVECSPDRIQASLGGYHNVEKELRHPTLKWEDDYLDCTNLGSLHFADCLDLPWRRPSDSPTLPFGSDRDDDASHGFSDSQQRVTTQLRSDVQVLSQLQRVADVVFQSVGSFDPVVYSGDLESEGRGSGFKHGPGAVADRLKGWEKSQFPNWPAKLERWFPFEACGTTASFTGDRPLNHELASRLICVPKTAKGPRLIAAEPVAHQWCQQLIWNWLRKRIRSTFLGSFVDFSKQSKSADMVIQASRDRKLATVDLSDASDRLSCWTMERMLRDNSPLLSVLHAARTRYLRDDISGIEPFIKLKKFASQGTATTFPVQSLVFLTIALASAIGDGRVSEASIRRFRNQVRVYGDDIIIPVHGYARLCRIMDLLQLKVSGAKSFVRGHFRESCGTDGYAGDDVTPVKPKVIVADGPASCQAVIDTSNNLFNKGYWYASHNLSSTLPVRVSSRIRIVGVRDAGFSGFTSFVGGYESHLEKRWNKSLHRYEGRVWAEIPRLAKRTRDGHHLLLEFFSRPENHEQARIVSGWSEVRKTKFGLLWEPLRECTPDTAPPKR